VSRANTALWVTLSVGLALALYAWLPADGATLALGGERYALAYPRALSLLGLSPLFVLVAMRSHTDLERLSLGLATTLRVFGFGAVAIALALPSRLEERRDLAIAVAVDVSDSIADEGLVAAAALIGSVGARARDTGGDIELAATAFAGHARRIQPNDEGALVPTRTERGEESNLGAALLHAVSLLPSDRARRVLMVSDGIETRGDAISAAARLRELGVEVHTMAAEGEVPLEVALLDLELPPRIEAGRPFLVKAKIFATRATDARVRLRQGAVPNALMPMKRARLEAGENVVDFESIAHVKGPVSYRALVDLDAPDRFPGNQEVEVTAVVDGRPQVLVVAESRARTSSLTTALSATGHGVEVIAPSSMPTDPAAFERFVGVILLNLPASAVSDARQAALLEATRARGLTLLVAGGDRSYGLGGWEGTRMAEALPVRLDGEKRRDRPSLALVLVMDKSGSMAGAKIELAKEAAKATADLLAPDDYLSVIGFDSTPHRVVRMQTARNRIGIRRDISRIAAGGGTAIFPALDMAYQDLSVTRARIKHVILLTDGQAPEAGIPELTRVMRAEGITVSTIGLGSDVQRGLLESIAALGGGRSHFTNDPNHVPRIFMRETSTVSRSAVVEELVTIVPAKRAAFLRGLALERAPFLRGYVATRMKPAPAEQLLVTELGEPLLARRRHGAGHVLAWTSDLEPRWAVDFMRWPRFAAFLSQLLREHRRDETAARLPMTISRHGDVVRVTVNALGDDDTLLRGLESTVRLLDARGEPLAEAQAEETAPGIYEASFALETLGSFRVEAEHRRGEFLVAIGDARFSHPYPDEWSRLGTDEARLADVARAGGGALLDSLDDLFASPPPTSAPAPIADWFILFALLSFLFDLLLRRTRFFER
jgi:Ca-activated chloride channel homolog